MTPLIMALLPLATQFVVPLIEKVIGNKKNPTDTQTGSVKQNNAVAILQQMSANLGVSGTDVELKQIIDMAVQILKPLGLDNVSKTGNLSGTPNIVGTFPVTFSGNIQVGAATK